MNKKYSLRETWKHCMAMWKYVAENWNGSSKHIYVLKSNWLEHNGFSYIGADCFFCHYQGQHEKRFRKNINQSNFCEGCPGGEVAPRFDCYDSEWDTDPVKFYRVLKRMYAKKKKLAGWK